MSNKNSNLGFLCVTLFSFVLSFNVYHLFHVVSFASIDIRAQRFLVISYYVLLNDHGKKNYKTRCACARENMEVFSRKETFNNW